MNHPSVFSEFLEFDAFLRSIKQNLDGSFGVLVGAGASISSGVQSADDCIWDWKAAIYQTLSGDKQQIIDPKRSMASRVLIQQWLDAQHVYPPADDPSEYSFYAEKAYPIETDRVKYLLTWTGKSEKKDLLISKLLEKGFSLVSLKLRDNNLEELYLKLTEEKQ